MEAPTAARSLFGVPKLGVSANGARRCLFGSNKKEEHRIANRALIEKYQRILTDRDSARWNFNFESGKPLPGSHQWEVVNNVPEVYSRMCEETERACSTPPARRRRLSPVVNNYCQSNPSVIVSRALIPPPTATTATTQLPPTTNGATQGSETRENRPVQAAEQSTSSSSSSSSTTSTVQQQQETSPSISSGRGTKRKQPLINGKPFLLVCAR